MSLMRGCVWRLYMAGATRHVEVCGHRREAPYDQSPFKSGAIDSGGQAFSRVKLWLRAER